MGLPMDQKHRENKILCFVTITFLSYTVLNPKFPLLIPSCMLTGKLKPNITHTHQICHRCIEL
jgi:hypothetical protein